MRADRRPGASRRVSRAGRARLAALGILLVATAGHPPAAAAARYRVPFSVTTSGHVMVRVKIDGRGPFHCVVDTGAPALVLAPTAVRRPGDRDARTGWRTLGSLAIEGGPVIPRPQALVTDVYQLEGMNRLGLSEVELHGVIGYTILARYRIELDLSRRRMAWTELAYRPPAPQSLGALGVTLWAVSAVVRLAASVMGLPDRPPPVARGLAGIEVRARGRAVEVVRVLAGSAAARAGVRSGDRIVMVSGRPVSSMAQIRNLTRSSRAGHRADLIVERSGTRMALTVTLGDGL
jgi:hypothetical protein